MKKDVTSGQLTHFLFLLGLLMLTACSSSKETKKEATHKTPLAENTTPPIPNLTGLVDQPLPQGADKFKGEYQANFASDLRIRIRSHPKRAGLLALTMILGSRKPATVSYYYSPDKDILSNRFSEEEEKFSVLKIDPSGKMITDIQYNLYTHSTDTTIYIRQ